MPNPGEVPRSVTEETSDERAQLLAGINNGPTREHMSELASELSEGEGPATHWFLEHFKPGGPLTSMFTLCAMSLGVGVFVLPAVFKSIGFISGIVAILFFAFWSYWLQVVLIRVAKSYDVHSYEMCAMRSLGPAGKYGLATFTAITNLLANSAHMKTAVLLLHDEMELYITGSYGKDNISRDKELILYVILLGLAFMLSSGGAVAELRFVSTASVTIVLTLCLWCTGECFFYYWPQGTLAGFGHNSIKLGSTDWEDYAAGLPAVAFAFTSTFMLFPVYREMKDQSTKSVRRVVAASTWVCGVGYMVLAVIAVLTFGKDITVNGENGKATTNYLYVFPPSHYVIVFLSFCLAIALTLLYAIINYPFIIAIETLLTLLPFGRGREFLTPVVRHSLITASGMVVLVFVNLAFSSLEALFGLCGGWGVTFVVYAIPSAIAIGAGKRADPEWTSMPVVLHRVALWASLLLVLLIAAAYTYTLFA